MADDSELIGQDDIEALLNQAKGAASTPPASPDPANSGASLAASDSARNKPEAVRQDEIETLLNGAGGAAARPVPSTATASAGKSVGGGTATATQPGARGMGAGTTSSYGTAGARVSSAGDDIQLLLDQAELAIASVNDPNPSLADAQAFQFRDLAGSPPSNEKATIDLLRDVELDLKIELGRTHMELEELLKLRRGSVVSLDKLAGDPVDVYVNGRLIARGEVLVLNDNFCVRVAELISGDE
ncbi:MAG: flagellar motor switch protein FliN [Planctomycetota bacterium]|nr:flagellar motor switch protein FliN [Planctomycetota bacterium]